MEIIYLDLDECSEEELVFAINNNNRYISNIEQELKMMKKETTQVSHDN